MFGLQLQRCGIEVNKSPMMRSTGREKKRIYRLREENDGGKLVHQEYPCGHGSRASSEIHDRAGEEGGVGGSSVMLLADMSIVGRQELCAERLTSLASTW